LEMRRDTIPGWRNICRCCKYVMRIYSASSRDIVIPGWCVKSNQEGLHLRFENRDLVLKDIPDDSPIYLKVGMNQLGP
jgi:hypothetical protein